jgi:hypothetical protein
MFFQIENAYEIGCSSHTIIPFHLSPQVSIVAKKILRKISAKGVER